jgi:hypothetical protein
VTYNGDQAVIKPAGNVALTLSVLRPLAAIVLGHFSGNFTRVLIHAIKKF